MSFEIILELDGNPPDWNHIADALLRAGAEDVDQLVHQDKEELTSFSDSGLLVYAMKYENSPRIVPSAEGDHQCSFAVSWQLVFRMNRETDSDKCKKNIHEFLLNLTEISNI